MSKDVVIHVSIGVLSTFIVSWLNIRPLGVLCIGGLLTWLYVLFCPCTFTLENVRPIQDKVRANMATFAQLRQEKPAVFCLIVSVTLFLLMILGHILSGTWLVIGGLSVVGLISSRHSIRIVRADPKGISNTNDTPKWSPSSTLTATPLIDRIAATVTSQNNDVDEFLPEVNESAMQVLNLAGDDAILLSAKPIDDEDGDSDSVPLEMLMPEETVPDVDQAHLTDENLSGDEFRGYTATAAVAAGTGTRVARSDHLMDTSDEEEESLSRGLNFEDYNVVDGSQQPPALVASYHSHKGGSRKAAAAAMQKGLTDFVSNIIPWNNLMAGGDGHRMSQSEGSGRRSDRRATSEQKSSMDSSDDSEFEILNPDELKSYHET